jgi:DnaJ-class molecular chaperone
MNRTEALKILNSTEPCTPADLKKHYHILSLKYHPDKNSDYVAQEICKLVNQAYQFLTKTSPVKTAPPPQQTPFRNSPKQTPFKDFEDIFKNWNSVNHAQELADMSIKRELLVRVCSKFGITDKKASKSTSKKINKTKVELWTDILKLELFKTYEKFTDDKINNLCIENKIPLKIRGYRLIEELILELLLLDKVFN